VFGLLAPQPHAVASHHGPPLQASYTTIASTLCMHGCVELSGARASPPRHLSYRVALVPCARHVGLWCESDAIHVVLPVLAPQLHADACRLGCVSCTVLRTYSIRTIIHTHAWPWAKLGPGHRTHAPRPPCSRVTRHRLGWLGHESGARLWRYVELAPQD
jgi:hypothetical protein